MSPTREPEKSRSRVATAVHTVEELVGAHTTALEAIFSRGSAADPAALGSSPRGRVLALAGTGAVHLAAREVVRLFSRGAGAVWQGIVFDHGGNAGANRFFGREGLRFRAEIAASKLDGAPALILSYEKAGFPFSRARDELRLISPRVAIGPTFLGDTLLGWVGFDAD